MQNRPPTRAAIYARSARRDNDSIDRQVVACTQYVHSRGYNTIDVYVDNGASGGSPSALRPELADLLTNIGQYGVIVVWDFDRIARNPRDLETVMDTAEHHGTRVENVDGLDLHSDTGRLVTRMLVAIDGGAK